MSESNRSKWRPVLVVAICAVGALAGTGILAYYAITQWMQPATPVVLAATAVFLPVAALTVFVGLVGSDPDEPVDRTLRLPVGASLLTGLLVAGAAATWFSPRIRAEGLDRAVQRGYTEAVSRALYDPNPGLVVSACASLFELGIGGQRQRLMGLLDARPAIAKRCLRRARSTPHAARYADILIERWHRELLAGRGDRRRPCRLAAQLGDLPGAPSGGIPALLSCSLSSSAAPIRKCCTRSLIEAAGADDKLADRMGGSVVRSVSEQLAAPLVQASLHQLQMSKAAKRRADRLGLGTDAVGRYAAAMACAHLREIHYPGELTDQLTAWLEQASCSFTIQDAKTNVRGWGEVCRDISRLHGEHSDPDKLLCQAVRARATREAISTARATLESAFAGADYQFMQARIAAGVAMRQGRRRGPLGGFDRMADDGFGKSALMRRILRHMESEQGREEIEKLVVATRPVRKAAVEEPAENIGDLDVNKETKEKYEKMNDSRAYEDFYKQLEQSAGGEDSLDDRGTFRTLRGSGNR